MDQAQLEEKLKKIKKRREQKRVLRRVKEILRIHILILVVVGIFMVAKNLTIELTADARKTPVVQEEKEKIQESPEISLKSEILKEEKNQIKQEFPKPPDREPESMTVIINRDFPLPYSYIPEDLTVPDVRLLYGHDSERSQLRKPAAEALEVLFQAAEEEGIILYAVSGYRSFKTQSLIYAGLVKSQGIEEASTISAVPGTSEHQSGLAMDISCKGNQFGLSEEFADTKEGKWIAEEAYKYGFVIRYEKEKEEITGYAFEPWHLRFVGKELAEILYRNQLSLEEYYGLSAIKK